MARAAAVKPVITPEDRLGLTLSLAILAHGMLILGVTFIEEDLAPARYDTMEIVLVRQKSPPPEEAEALAQASLAGGGETADPVQSGSPLPDPGLGTPPARPALAPPAPAPAEAAPTETAPTGSDNPPEIAVQGDSGPPAPVETAAKPVEATPEKTPSATALLASSFRIAALSANIRQKLETRAQRPKRKFISASTKEYRYAAYMEAWRAKVERMGNLNYPEEARRRKLSGSLLLEVALNANGTINEIMIRRSSGEKVLDDAAIRIVELAAPYAPFPQKIKQETGILHIIRTWQFMDNQGFR